MANEFDALKPVQSSMFSRVGYDDEKWLLLFEFRSTKEIRAYRQVSPEVADECLAAKSIGTWWNQNVKGNSGWEFDVLGADPSQQIEVPKEGKVVPIGGLDDEDLKYMDPNYSAKKPAEAAPDDFGVKSFDPETGHWPIDAVTDDGQVKPEAVAAMTTQTHGEVLPKWETPETAGQALELMSEHETEIAAIISQNLHTGQQALMVKVTDADTRVQASEVLDRLVAKKDTTVGLLDPFRKVLHEAYSYAGQKVKDAVSPLDSGVAHVKSVILAWDRAQEAIRQQKIREANAAAEAEARRRQEEERQRLTLAEVGDALEQGDEQKAQMLFDNPIEVPKPYVQPEYISPSAPAIKGQSARSNWKVVEEELNVVAFLRAVKDGSFPLDQASALISFNIPALNGLAKSLKGSFNIPGARAEDQGSLSVRRKK